MRGETSGQNPTFCSFLGVTLEVFHYFPTLDGNDDGDSRWRQQTFMSGMKLNTSHSLFISVLTINL